MYAIRSYYERLALELALEFVAGNLVAETGTEKPVEPTISRGFIRYAPLK